MVRSTRPDAASTDASTALPCSPTRTRMRDPGRVPDRGRRMLAARRALIAADPSADVEVVAGGQVAGRAAGDFRDPEIGLVVRPLRLRVCRRDEGDALAVAREGVRADGPVDVDDPPRLPATAGHGVEVAVAGIVVGLALPVRDEVDVVAVGRPLVVAGAEFSARNLCRRRNRAGVRERRDPDLRRAIGIDVTGAGDAVGAVSRVGDHANVALALRPIAARGFGRRLVGARQFIGPRGGGKCDRLAVGGPGRRSGAARDIGDRPRLAAAHGHDVDLRRLHAALCLGGANERQARSVGGPSRAAVSRAGGERLRRCGAGAGAGDPDRRLVLFLLPVDGDAQEGDPRSVRGHLRIRDPHEREQVGLGNRPAGGGLRRNGQRERCCDGHARDPDRVELPRHR